MADGMHRLGPNRTRAAEVQQYSRRSFFIFIHNQTRLGQHHMHAGAAHALDHRYAARQLTLQRAHLIILLHKIRHTHGVFIIK